MKITEKCGFCIFEKCGPIRLVVIRIVLLFNREYTPNGLIAGLISLFVLL